jgi:hypothetical protein
MMWEGLRRQWHGGLRYVWPPYSVGSKCVSSMCVFVCVCVCARVCVRTRVCVRVWCG